MDWYYAKDGEQAGPFTDKNFASLVALGVIDESTPVRHDGMADWQPYGELLTLEDGVGDSAYDIAECAQCGRSVPADELIEQDGRCVCLDCGPVVSEATLMESLDSQTQAEVTRSEHLEEESAAKSIGALYCFSGIWTVFAELKDFVAVVTTPPTVDTDSILWSNMAFITVGVALFVTGFEVRRFRPWTRIPAGIVALILGLMCAFVQRYDALWDIVAELFPEEGRVVFSNSYQEVIAATPHLKSRTWGIVWVMISLLSVIVALVMLA